MSLEKKTKRERVGDGRRRKVRLARTRVSTRKASYGWRLIVEGFRGQFSLGYYKENERGAKRCALDTLKRMRVKKEGGE